MEATFDGITLEFSVEGEGPAVLFIHGALLADTFATLIGRPEVGATYRCITYRRRGYGTSTRPRSLLAVDDHAHDAANLLRGLSPAGAHVVGHSYGGAVALQLALDAPELVQSLILLEPAVVSGEAREPYLQSFRAALSRVQANETVETVDDFFRARFGHEYRSWLEDDYPDAFAEAVTNAPATFAHEVPGLADWQFDAAVAARIDVQTLLVIGSRSPSLWSRFAETHRELLGWLPHAEEYVLPGATHALQMENPRDLAARLSEFWERHASTLLT